MLACFNVLPSVVLYERFYITPYSDRLYDCGVQNIESLEHVILYCTYYLDIHTLLIEPILWDREGQSDEYIIFLLSIQNPMVIETMAKFLHLASKSIRMLWVMIAGSLLGRLFNNIVVTPIKVSFWCCKWDKQGEFLNKFEGSLKYIVNSDIFQQTDS